MTHLKLTLRSLAFYWRTSLGTLAGCAVAVAVLVGALAVGDSVRFSLRRMALARLGDTTLALHTADRYFTDSLAASLPDQLQRPAAPLLDLPAVAVHGATDAAVPAVHLLGVDDRFWSLAGVDSPIPADAASSDIPLAINSHLAERLGARVGDRLLLRFAKPSAISPDIPLTAVTDSTLTLVAPIAAILDDARFGRYSLRAEQLPPLNVFVPLEALQREADLAGRANTILVGGGDRPPTPTNLTLANQTLESHLTLADASLQFQPVPDRQAVQLRTDRVFLDPPLTGLLTRSQIDPARPYITYFVDSLSVGERSVPYSTVSATPNPGAGESGVEPAVSYPLPTPLESNQIALNQWAADQLGATIGDTVTLRYPVLGSARAVEHRTAEFTLAAIYPTEAAGADRHLMPDLPGLTDADSPLDWRPPAELGIDLRQIRKPDEDYWRDHRGSPKAFVSYEWAAANFATRFGVVTSLRWPDEPGDSPRVAMLSNSIRSMIDPASIGLVFRDERTPALAAASSGTDFGGLFIGLSFFLMIAALLLTSILFAFGVEQRTSESGLLRAVGFSPARLRSAWLTEALILAAAGAALGLAAAVGYTRAILWALTTLWSGALPGASSLTYHAEPLTLFTGAVAGIFVSLASIYLTIRRQARRSPRSLLAARFGLDDSDSAAPAPHSRRPSIAILIAALSLLGAIAAVAAALAGLTASAAPTFFAAGSLLLIAGLAFTRAQLRRIALGQCPRTLSLASLARRNFSRRASRSLATVAILACGAFLVVAVNAFRHDAAHDSDQRSSGTGGFALYMETTLPLHHDLSSPATRDQFALDESDLAGLSAVPMRLRAGDDASCLNLNRPQSPPLLGVDPALLDQRRAFRFTNHVDDLPQDAASPWSILAAADNDPASPVPAILDASVAQWILKVPLGGTIDYIDEAGNPFTVRIVATLPNSVLQGRLLISQQQFLRRFPSSAGYRVFLIDVDARDRAPAVQQTLQSALADVGPSIMSTEQRLALFLTVENTYLTIFAVLGGLGLTLGCLGLGLVVLRNTLERRAELALMRCLGFTRSKLRRLVLFEHALLLAAGLAIGALAATLAISPALANANLDAPYLTIAILLLIVLALGLLSTTLATLAALTGPMLEPLRAE